MRRFILNGMHIEDRETVRDAIDAAAKRGIAVRACQAIDAIDLPLQNKVLADVVARLASCNELTETEAGFFEGSAQTALASAGLSASQRKAIMERMRKRPVIRPDVQLGGDEPSDEG